MLDSDDLMWHYQTNSEKIIIRIKTKMWVSSICLKEKIKPHEKMWIFTKIEAINK